LFYRSPEDYQAGLVPFVTAGLAAGQPVLVALPTANLAALHDALGGRDAKAVRFADMATVGRNPARIIPAIRHFLDSHPGRRARVIGEPIWPGRSAAEICESTRHEAMLNIAFADAAVDLLCPYDVGGLDDATVADVWRTHPQVVDRETRHDSGHYDRPETMYSADAPLDAPPVDAVVIAVVHHDLSEVREVVRQYAARSGLSAARVDDLILAVNEIATNTLMHTEAAAGTLSIWCDDRGVVCDINDEGHIVDPFAGRRSPPDAATHGRGLWMANQLCDLVQLRSTPSGTTVRMHVTPAA
jgi:anti-sigma regulatory factor (Ser/Thr protein kinase)